MGAFAHLIGAEHSLIGLGWAPVHLCLPVSGNLPRLRRFLRGSDALRNRMKQVCELDFDGAVEWEWRRRYNRAEVHAPTEAGGFHGSP